MRTRSLLIAILLSCGPALAAGAAERLTILHTNDVHGHLLPFSYHSISGPGMGAAFAELPVRRDIGGVARRATLAARIRAEAAGEGATTWLVDGGDFFHYSPFSNEYHGVAAAVAMGRAGYDFGVLGNHEFEITRPQLDRLLAAIRYPVLCANVADSATGRPLGLRHAVRRVGAARVGLFGLSPASVPRYPAARGGLVVTDPVATAAAVVAELRGRERVDVVVLLSHCGINVDRELARRVPGLDVIVGAHSHTRLPHGEVVWWPGELKPDEVGGTVIVQTGQWGGELGRLDLLLDRGRDGRWRVVRHRARLVPVTSDIPDDPAVAAVLDSLWAPHAAKYDEVLATATADFANRGDDLPQNALYADLVRAELGVELAFEGTGGVHWPLVAGPVTRGSLVDLDQDAFSVLTFRVRGAELRRLLEQVRPAPSGLRYRMFRGRLDEVSVAGAPLDDARVYSCAASSYLADRLAGLDLLELRDTGRGWAEVVREGLRRAGTVTPVYDARRVVVNVLAPDARD